MFSYYKIIEGRSIHRKEEELIAQIKTQWVGDTSTFFTLKNSHLEEYPIFKTFNKNFFYKNLLPDNNINYRYNTQKKISILEIKTLINKVIQEIKLSKKNFSDFIILRSRDFNHKNCSGLIILKFKKLPFVVKIFIENPETFIQYNSKGIIPALFFNMAGGINRHLLGFTRVKNLQNIKILIAQNKKWSDLITLPRKWFFLPKKSRWIKITGTNIGKKKKQIICIPGTYCIISDWIDSERVSSVFNKTDRKICMELCNYLDLVIDPHIDNFLIERNTKKIAIVDTEHFLSVVGLKKKKKFTSYFSWITHLAGQFINDVFLRDKKTRRDIQLTHSNTELKYESWGPKAPTKNKNIKQNY